MIAIIFFIYCAVIAVTTLVTFINLVSAPQLKKKNTQNHKIKISICIPARNEEQNIKNILTDILIQSYSNFEILVLDDNSEDNTFNIITAISKINKNVQVISGDPLPSRWTGKNWACHQLSQKANGNILFFIDADCRLSPWAIESSAAYMDYYSLDMLSAFPVQRMNSLSEKIIVPIMDWILLTFLPLQLVYLSSRASLVAANGQFIAFKKEAYNVIGGHKSVANKIVEDMELARNIKKAKLKMMTFLGNNTLKCRMYKSFTDAFVGFSKNFFPGFNTKPFMFIVILLCLNMLYTFSFILLIFYKYFMIIIVLILLQRVFISATNKQNPLHNIILHPIQMIMMTLIGLNSIYKTKKGSLEWKGRGL
jgi:chlorobactene glucosyltransferase